MAGRDPESAARDKFSRSDRKATPMPRRARLSVLPALLDQLEPRQLLAAPDGLTHMPATYNHQYSIADIDAFMTGSDDPEVVEESTATSDADMYAGLKPTRFLQPLASSIPPEKPTAQAAPLSGKAPGRSFVDLTSDRERDDVDVPVQRIDDQAPVIVAAAHGDAKAIAIVATWADADSKNLSISVARPGDGAADHSVSLHASFVGKFPVKSRLA